MTNVSRIHIPVDQVFNDVMIAEIPSVDSFKQFDAEYVKPVNWKLIFMIDGGVEENVEEPLYCVLQDSGEIFRKIVETGYLLEVNTKLIL